MRECKKTHRSRGEETGVAACVLRFQWCVPVYDLAISRKELNIYILEGRENNKNKRKTEQRRSRKCLNCESSLLSHLNFFVKNSFTLFICLFFLKSFLISL